VRARRRRAAAALATAVLTGGAVLAALPDPAALSARGRAPEGASGVPRPVRPALPSPTPRPLRASKHMSRWAPVEERVAAHARPAAESAVVDVLGTVTPEGTTNIVSVLAHGTDTRGRVWVRVRLASLPNGRTGWVPRAALGGYGLVRTRLVVDLSRMRATLYRSGRPIFTAPVGVGRPQWATPTGFFYIRNKLSRYASPTYGPVAFGTSARSPTLTDWPAGGFIGIHGTDRPDLLPGRVSHGCIRMENKDILALARLMPVGTPLRIR
jgi:lipoprotein-anchoring transpeptidase ErfK/SrfK